MSSIKSILLNWRHQLLNDERYHSRLSMLIVSLTCACPVVLVMAFSYISTSQELIGSELSRRQAIVGMAAATLEEKLNRLTDLGSSLATRVRFRQLVEAGNWQEAIKILQAVPNDFSFINRLLIADTSGLVMAATPPLPGDYATSFADQVWYKGVTAVAKPYVSDIYRRTADSQEYSIVVAVPITNAERRLVGILTLQISSETFLAWIRVIDTGSRGFLFLSDRRGEIVAHAESRLDKKVFDYSKLAPVKEMLLGKRGIETAVATESGAEQVLAYEPIASFGWGVVLEQSRVSAFELMNRSLRRLLVACIAVGLAAFGIAYLLLRSLVFAKNMTTALSESREQFRAVAETANDGIVTSDSRGQIVFFNQAACRLFGYSANEVIGQPMTVIMPERFREAHRHGFERILSGGEATVVGKTVELAGRRKNGSEFPLELSLAGWHTDKGQFFTGIVRDITERKRFDEQLRAKNKQLETQNSDVQQANRLKSEFLANMSHELRTPLNAIIGFAQLMHDGKVGAIAAAHKEYLGDILGSSRHLLQLINDVLDLAKVESGKMEFSPEPVALTKIIGEVRQVLQALSASKRLAVEVEVSPAVERLIIDAAKLKQVLYNYLSNAIKFTPAEGRIKVHAVAEGADKFRLEVEDTGIGIVADDIDKLFAEFRQLESAATKKHQGTGLGLALTKKIVEAQGGEVGVRSTPGRGSVFYAVLPRIAERTKANAEPVQLSTPRAEDTPAVLVIEDNESDRAWLVRILADAGYAVDTAKTGAEALTLIEAETYRAILLDMILPDMIGWDVLHTIRQTGRNQSVPVIVISVINEREVAKGFPVQDYLAKPVSAEKLIQSLHRAEVRPNGTVKKILIIDDDPKILKIGSAALHSAGYEAVCSLSAAQGLVAATEAEFDAVVLDLLMPGVDGFEFLDRFRAINGCRNTPVIVWTNKDITAEDRDRLNHSAQLITSKASVGIDAVLRELQLYVGTTSETLVLAQER